MPSGRGAQSPAISMLPVSMRKSEQFSHWQPPCIAVDTMTAGKAAAGRSSRAHSVNVCVPPPDAPVTPTRLGSTSGRLVRKSRARMLFHVCIPMKLVSHISASTSLKLVRCLIAWLSA